MCPIKCSETSIYYAFVHPHIMHDIEIYANTETTYLDKLIQPNNKVLRILQHRPIISGGARN